MIFFLRRYALTLICWATLGTGSCSGTDPCDLPSSKIPSTVSEAPLVIYIRDSFYDSCAPFLKQATSRDIHFIRLSSSLLMGRLRREKHNTPADLVIGTDSCLSPELQELGVTAPNTIDPHTFHVPVPWTEPDIIPFCYGYLGFLYKSGTLSKPPQTLEDVLSSSLKIVMPHPRTSTVGLVFSDWLRTVAQKSQENQGDQRTLSQDHRPNATKDPLHQTWKRFEERLLSLPKGLPEAFALFMSGEADLMVAYTTSAEFAAVHRQDSGIQAVPLKASPFQAYTAFITPKGAHKPLAQKLLGLLLRKEIQRVIREKDCLYPVLPQLQQSLPFQTKEPQAAMPLNRFTRRTRRDLLDALTRGFAPTNDAARSITKSIALSPSSKSVL